MAHTGIFATSDEILVKAGENYDTGITEARINDLCLQVESQINISTQYNWSDAFASLNADVKGLLAMAESNLVAMYIISYNPSAIPSRTAETMLDLLRDGYVTCIEQLKIEAKRDFMIKGTSP
jgi:hypothetical protein